MDDSSDELPSLSDMNVRKSNPIYLGNVPFTYQCSVVKKRLFSNHNFGFQKMEKVSKRLMSNIEAATEDQTPTTLS